jgi:signal transduction histidine kinase
MQDVSPWKQDLWLAAALTVFTQWELSQSPFVAGSMTLQRVAFAVITMAVAWRRVAPYGAVAVAAVGLTVQSVWAGPAAVVGGFLAGLIVTHSVALYSSRRTAVGGLATVLAALTVSTVAGDEPFRLADFLGNVATFVTIWALGRAVRSGEQRSQVAEARVAMVQAEQDVQMREAIAAERGRIARELHDVVAHGVSVMVLQAGAARQMLERDPEQARDPLLAVESTGRQALDDMHRLLGILRTDDDAAVRQPLVGLADLPALVDRMRAVGLDVIVRVEGDEHELSPSLDLSTYRIVQESLTNAVKHAGAATVSVVIRYGATDVEVEVTDDGTRAPVGAWPGGHGVVGMRERASIFGGSLAAGPRVDEPGWVVRARLPFAGATT